MAVSRVLFGGFRRRDTYVMCGEGRAAMGRRGGKPWEGGEGGHGERVSGEGTKGGKVATGWV